MPLPGFFLCLGQPIFGSNCFHKGKLWNQKQGDGTLVAQLKLTTTESAPDLVCQRES